MEDPYEIVTSRLSRKFTRDGITVEILIYRGTDEEEWTLEVIDEDDASTVWEDPFATEADALNEAFQAIATDGIESFVRDREQKKKNLH
jgi:hypothetical protein